jgi:hypothetical protein
VEGEFNEIGSIIDKPAIFKSECKAITEVDVRANAINEHPPCLAPDSDTQVLNLEVVDYGIKI